MHPCRRICTSPPVRLDHLFFTGRFCLQCFVSLPSAVFSYVQTPKQTLLMSARSSFHWEMITFLVTPSMCCVFICTNSRHTLKTIESHAMTTPSICCVHMYKPQSNLNSRQRRKSTVAARKKRNWLNFPLKILSHLLAWSDPNMIPNNIQKCSLSVLGRIKSWVR